jgi:hypothetical protein
MRSLAAAKSVNTSWANALALPLGAALALGDADAALLLSLA